MTRLRLACLLLIGPVLSGCQIHPSGIVDALTPETIQVGLTAPNLVNGPIAATRTGQSRRDAFGQIGVSLSATYRLKPIKIERGEVQPVAVVSPAPMPVPTPKP